jgi:hypothetical protein
VGSGNFHFLFFLSIVPKRWGGWAFRLSMVKATKGELPDELTKLKFEGDTPLHLAMTSKGTELLVAMAAGGIALVRVALEAGQAHPSLTWDRSAPLPCLPELRAYNGWDHGKLGTLRLR